MRRGPPTQFVLKIAFPSILFSIRHKQFFRKRRAPIFEEKLFAMKIIQHFLAFFLLFSAFQAEAKFRENILFTTQLDGAQMWPATASAAKGIGTVMLNKKRDSLSVSFSVVGLTPTYAAIFIGAEGENGTLLFDLSDGIS